MASDSPFETLEAFIAYAASPVTGYHLDVTTSPGPMRDALETYVRQRQGTKAIFVGVRVDDPHGGALAVRSRCDPGWPDILRIHPILAWDYASVWAFLRCAYLGTDHAPSEPYVAGGGPAGVPYCAMYDQGYTSLGSTHNTRPNPFLKKGDGYAPAYCLRDGRSERAGRAT